MPGTKSVINYLIRWIRNPNTYYVRPRTRDLNPLLNEFRHVAYTSSQDATSNTREYHECLEIGKSISSRKSLQLKLPHPRHGHCKSSTETNLGRSNEHSPQHSVFSSVSQETETRTPLIPGNQIQEFSAWPERKGGIYSA